MTHATPHFLALFGAKANLLLSAHFFAAGRTYSERALGYLLKRPASLLGLPKRNGGYPVMGAPLLSAHEIAVKRQPNIRAHIVNLLLSRGQLLGSA